MSVRILIAIAAQPYQPALDLSLDPHHPTSAMTTGHTRPYTPRPRRSFDHDDAFRHVHKAA